MSVAVTAAEGARVGAGGSVDWRRPSTPIDTDPVPAEPPGESGPAIRGTGTVVTTDHIPSSAERRRSFDVPRVLAWVAVVAVSVALWVVAVVAVAALV